MVRGFFPRSLSWKIWGHLSDLELQAFTLSSYSIISRDNWHLLKYLTGLLFLYGKYDLDFLRKYLQEVLESFLKQDLQGEWIRGSNVW